MKYKLINRRCDFCRYAVEAWVIVGVMCERQTFYGNDLSTVHVQAMRWVKWQSSEPSEISEPADGAPEGVSHLFDAPRMHDVDRQLV